MSDLHARLAHQSRGRPLTASRGCACAGARKGLPHRRAGFREGGARARAGWSRSARRGRPSRGPRPCWSRSFRRSTPRWTPLMHKTASVLDLDRGDQALRRPGRRLAAYRDRARELERARWRVRRRRRTLRLRQEHDPQFGRRPRQAERGPHPAQPGAGRGAQSERRLHAAEGSAAALAHHRAQRGIRAGGALDQPRPSARTGAARIDRCRIAGFRGQLSLPVVRRHASARGAARTLAIEPAIVLLDEPFTRSTRRPSSSCRRVSRRPSRRHRSPRC